MVVKVVIVINDSARCDSGDRSIDTGDDNHNNDSGEFKRITNISFYTVY